MFESLVEWKNGTVSTDIHLQAEISGSMPRVVLRESNKNKLISWNDQSWTEGRSSTAVAEDLRPTATATVAEVWGHSYGRRSYW